MFRRSKSDIILFFLSVTLIGMTWSKFLISQGIIWLTVVSLLDFDAQSPYKIRWSKYWLENVKQWKKFLPALSVTLLFIPILLSGIYSDNIDLWWERVRIKLPLLFLPFVFLGIPTIRRHDFLKILYFFVFLMVASATFVVIRYLLNFESYNLMLQTGRAIPAPLHHIRFSLLLCCAILIGLYLYRERFYWKYHQERLLLLVTTIIGIVCLHILAVRSGIVTFYICCFFLLIKELIRYKNIKTAIIGLVALVLLPMLAYQFIPGFKTKLEYMKWDRLQYQQNIGQNYSDSERLISIQAGLDVGNQSPIFGVGAGDVKEEIEKVYKSKYPEYSNTKLPHNQFIMTYSSVGLVGLLAFVFGLFYSLFSQKNYRNTFFLFIHLLVFLSFMVECTLETSQGVALYSVFWLLGNIDLWKTKA